MKVARISRHDRHVNRHDRIAVMPHRVAIHQHDRHRGVAATIKRLGKALMRVQVHADPAAKLLTERDHNPSKSATPRGTVHRRAVG